MGEAIGAWARLASEVEPSRALQLLHPHRDAVELGVQRETREEALQGKLLSRSTGVERERMTVVVTTAR
jgi:hypothetical protein